jgi:cytidylate kinase
MKKFNKLIIACDGESASGKSTAAKLISKKYGLLLVNSGLLYRYASKLVIDHKPKNEVEFLRKKFEKVSYKKISKLKLHSEKISNHVAILAKNKKIREIVNKVQKLIIKKNNKICVEGRDIASKILSKNPKYDLAFYFKCSLNVASYRRWLDNNKSVSLKEVKRSLNMRTKIDKNRKHSPLVRVKDSVLIRSDKLSKKEVINKMSFFVDKHLLSKNI